MSIMVIGFYEDDDFIEVCSMIYYEVIGMMICLFGGEDVLLVFLMILKVGGLVCYFVIVMIYDEFLVIVCDCDWCGELCLVFGGGLNVFVGDNGFDGIVVCVVILGLFVEVLLCGGVLVMVVVGQVWDDFVVYVIEQEWIGLEFFFGIFGFVGLMFIQNVGVYGVEVGEFIVWVCMWDCVDDIQCIFIVD